MLLWGCEPVDDALMYKRIGANNWRQEFSIYWVICINVRVLPIDTFIKTGQVLRGKRVISRMFIQWDFQPRA